MKYLKLFEDYFTKLTKVINGYEYKQVPSMAGVDFRKQIMELNADEVQTITNFVLLLNVELTDIGNEFKSFSFTTTSCRIVIHKIKDDYFFMKIRQLGTPGVHTYECDELEGLLHCIKDNIKK